MMIVHYIPYHAIDFTKWNHCINTAANGNIYAASFYLDDMAKNWDALVLNDYEYVMPLTWNKKYGIYYLYQPFFCASLGVYGNNITASIFAKFISAIPVKFKYCDIYCNHANYFEIKGIDVYQRINYVLPLNQQYELIYKNFRENLKRNINKAVQLNCIVKKNIPVNEVIELAKQQSVKFSPVKDDDYLRFKKVFEELAATGKAITYGVYTSSNELVASCVFFFSHKRAYYILVGNHPNGKTIGASHAIINAFIKDFAHQDLLLDFEGSDIKNLAFFYSSFGANEEKYCGIKFNRLPFWIKWFKK